MNEDRETGSLLMTKWLRALMYIAAISLANSLAGLLRFVPGSATTWISRGIMAAMVYCMARLAPASHRYQKAAIFRGAMLGCALVTSFVTGSSILTLAASILSILAVYQEYNGHSEVIAHRDRKLAQKWHSLFTWSILASVLLSFGTTVAAVILVMSEWEVSAARISGMVTVLLSVPQTILEIVYLTYLKRMVTLLDTDEVKQYE